MLWELEPVAGKSQTYEGAAGRDNDQIPLVQQKNQTLLPTDPESQQYLELMREFAHYMQRWREVLFSPEYQVSYDYSQKGRGGRTGGFDIIEVDSKPQIVPSNDSNVNSEKGIVRVQASLTYQRSNLGKVIPTTEHLSFIVTSLRDDGLYLTDPKTNMPLREIYLAAIRKRQVKKSGKQPPGIYEISARCYSAETYAREHELLNKTIVHSKYEYGTDYALNRNGSIGINKENSSTITINQHQHNQAIFQLVDSFIPRQEPGPATGQRIPVRQTAGRK